MSFMIRATQTLLRFCKNRKKTNPRLPFSIYHSNCLDEQKQKRQEMEVKRKEIMARGLPKRKPLKGVKQIVIVASGKGGVGKSTTAVNLSASLKILEPEKSIGLLDADVFGPSIPLMMNVTQTPVVNKEKLMEPVVNYGVKCMSMGFLTEDNDKSSVIWRGPMVMSAINTLLYQVAWQPLDYLIIDTPPGTGDTHLSIIQNLPISGVLLVTTPQRAALQVTRRGAGMFKKLNIPIIGIVENMSSVTCSKCANEIALFGAGTSEMARELDTQILQKIPLSEDITKNGDKGKPIVLSAPHSAEAEAYKRLGEGLISFLNKSSLKSESH